MLSVLLTVLLSASTATSRPAPDADAVVAAPPAVFTANPRIGPGGSKFKDYAHFRVYNHQNDAEADTVARALEAAHQCFVVDLGWRSSGLSYKQSNDDGPFYKLNVYRVDSLPGAAANTPLDTNAGLAWLNVVTSYMNTPSVTVHEFGHALTYAAGSWIDQTRTGAWWETVANFVADTYLTSPACARARQSQSQSEGPTMIDLKKTISDSFQVLVDATRDTGNYYQAWPFLTYLFNNPDGFAGLGKSVFPGVWTQYKRNSNETPLHVLERMAAPTRIQAVVGKYWARMAYVDIGHPKAQKAFLDGRSNLNFANWDSQGNGRYRVKSARQPRYMGSNITPLKTTPGNVSVTVTAGSPFTATLAIRSTSSGAVRYVDLVNGNGQTTIANGEEATLVVANTPNMLIMYDAFSIAADANRGLDYTVQLTGATM